MSCDCSAPEIAEAYEAVRNDNDATNWMLITWAEGSKDKVWTLAGKGNGGLAELKELLNDAFIGFGYLRVISGDEMSKRPKFVMIKFVGKQNKLNRKANINVQRGDVEKVLAQCNVSLEVDTVDELTEEDVMDRVYKAGGAKYGTASNI